MKENTYEYRFGTKASLILKVGKETKTIEFHDGLKSPRKIYPHFSTTDPEIQNAISEHKLFKTGVIRLVKSKDISTTTTSVSNSTETTGKTNNASETGTETSGTVVEDVTKVQQAKEWLIDNAGAKLSDLPNKEAILNFAAAKGIVFPNL